MPTYVRLAAIGALIAAPLVAATAQGGDEPNATPPRSVSFTGTVDVPLLDPGIRASLPVIAVMINGRGPYRFGVETGAGFVAISRALADSLALKRKGGTDDFPEYDLDSVTFGAASFRTVRVASIPRNATGVDGLLGLPFFHDVTFTIDYPANRLRLTRDTLPAVNGRDILPLQHVGPFWGLPITIAGQALTAVLDTRSTTGMSITPKGAAALPFDGELRVIGRSGGAGIPGADVSEGRLNGNAQIGMYTLPNPVLAVRELPPGFPEGPLVGSRILRNFVVSLDQRRQRLRLARQGSNTIELGSERGGPVPPVATNPNDGSVVAQYAGNYGDRTLSVSDGKLYIQRPGGQQLELTRTGPDAFGIVGIPEAKIEFGRDGAGKVAEIRVLNQQGQWERARRDTTQ